jgi:integral membrane protein
MTLSDKQIRILSIVATLMAVGMYVAYIPQIQMNLAGQKGSPLQPLIAAINCTLWVTYALGKKNRDIPVALANAPGIVLGLVAFVTSL